MKDQPLDVVGDFHQEEFRIGTRDADCADEETKAVRLMREHMLDRSADRRFGGIRPRDVLRQRLARLACGDGSG